ncbi:hypothetical protein AV530_005772 [Patagioenas fasciata monilis]|uniref:Secreted protein n=1 Tax=Patagioenas fasciata monilis TaxID=372326 RepID=A0A1V4JN08_PATFA|nr:hypothetical protein AV530_005772 [Patagioenas fasciata monilis]
MRVLWKGVLQICLVTSFSNGSSFMPTVHSQTMEMVLDKRQMRVIFLFVFKMGRKAAETTCNMNNEFNPGTANKCTVR